MKSQRVQSIGSFQSLVPEILSISLNPVRRSGVQRAIGESDARDSSMV